MLWLALPIAVAVLVLYLSSAVFFVQRGGGENLFRGITYKAFVAQRYLLVAQPKVTKTTKWVIAGLFLGRFACQIAFGAGLGDRSFTNPIFDVERMIELSLVVAIVAGVLVLLAAGAVHVLLRPTRLGGRLRAVLHGDQAHLRALPLRRDSARCRDPELVQHPRADPDGGRWDPVGARAVLRVSARVLHVLHDRADRRRVDRDRRAGLRARGDERIRDRSAREDPRLERAHSSDHFGHPRR